MKNTGVMFVKNPLMTKSDQVQWNHLNERVI